VLIASLMVFVMMALLGDSSAQRSSRGLRRCPAGVVFALIVGLLLTGHRLM
jgi:hypothetical protein